MSDNNQLSLRPVGVVRGGFTTKFGIPRQSGIVPELISTVELLPEYGCPEAVRGLEGFSHIWLIWEFSLSVREDWSPTVRPPRLGGNERRGVFATRSPFRPNPLGISCVKLEKILTGPDGIKLVVSGADIMDGTPVYDIKPYVPLADCIADARGGFTDEVKWHTLTVLDPAGELERLPEELRRAARGVLGQDPRPQYQQDAQRVYGFEFYGFEIRFTVDGELLTVRKTVKISERRRTDGGETETE